MAPGASVDIQININKVLPVDVQIYINKALLFALLLWVLLVLWSPFIMFWLCHKDATAPSAACHENTLSSFPGKK
jgi:hypothetical protein